MNREQRLLLGFLGIVLAIGAFIFQYVPLIEEEKADIVISWPITAALVNKAEGWRVKGPSGLVSLKQEQEKWRITEPVQTQVNPEKMKSFCGNCQRCNPRKKFKSC